MALSCIVFDCDGIILESVDVKTAAYAAICRDVAPPYEGEFLEYVTLHGGVSRFEKFEWLARKMFGRGITPEESSLFGEKFIQCCLDAVLAAPQVPGFKETAERWFGRVPMYVASGTPQYELEEVIRRHGLDHYFAGVFGTPPAKAALLAHAVRDSGGKPKQTVMIGDSKTDLDAAIIVGTRFYGRGQYFANGNYPWDDDLTGLNEYLERVAADDVR